MTDTKSTSGWNPCCSQCRSVSISWDVAEKIHFCEACGAAWGGEEATEPEMYMRTYDWVVLQRKPRTSSTQQGGTYYWVSRDRRLESYEHGHQWAREHAERNLYPIVIEGWRAPALLHTLNREKREGE